MENRSVSARRVLAAMEALAIAVVVAFATLAFAGVSPGAAYADELSTQASGINKTVAYSYLKGSPKNKMTITSPVPVEGLRSSNAGVVAATRSASGRYIYVLLKGAGTATVTYNVNGVPNSITYKVYKYENPVSKFRVGKKKHLAKKFAKGREFGLDFKESKFRKVVVEPADGWEIVSIYRSAKYSTVQNGGKAPTPGNLHVELRNKSTGVEETLAVYDPGYYS